MDTSIISIDCETTGLDLHHGARPFLVTTCDSKGKQLYWEWDVNPKTRQPIIPQQDINDIKELIYSAKEIVLHNAKFDIHALKTIIPDLEWDWNKTHDTLIAAHVDRSNQNKGLDEVSLVYLGVDINKYEDKMAKECKSVAYKVRKYFPSWRLAKAGDEDNPSAKEKTWKFDTWILRAFAKAMQWHENHPYYTITHDYANVDSECTMRLWLTLKNNMERDGRYDFYKFRMKTLKIAYEMECSGVNFIPEQAELAQQKYSTVSNKVKQSCVSIAEKFGYTLDLPKKGVNDNLRVFYGEYLKLPPVYKEKKSSKQPKEPKQSSKPKKVKPKCIDGRSYDKETMIYYINTLPARSTQLKFVELYDSKRDYDTSLAYLETYKKFTIKREIDGKTYRIIYPNFNPTATKTLRWSSSNPNAQNIKKNDEDKGDKDTGLRQCFGPAYRREWWSLDAKNVELRIPFYESGEPSMIDLFEKENEPPYYGSNHILIFSVLWSKLWNDAIKEVGLNKAGPYCKKKYKTEEYQWTKNGNFAIQYGCGESKADQTYRQKGAYRIINQRFSKLKTLTQRCIDYANQYRYIETLPDRTINPEHGYPLYCTETETGGILSTIPLSYRVQGTAMWVTSSAMIKCEQQLEEWRKHDNFNAFIAIQVHDEIVLDMPKRANPKENPRQSNLGRVRVIQHLLESCGEDLIPRIPIPFGCEYHPNHWGEGISF